MHVDDNEENGADENHDEARLVIEVAGGQLSCETADKKYCSEDIDAGVDVLPAVACLPGAIGSAVSGRGELGHGEG